MRRTTLIVPLILTALGTAAGAQCKFDYITFDKIQLDPNYALATTTQWGLLVNTGTQPISLREDWEKGVWYGESSQQLGSFFFEQLNPFGGDFVLQPGDAVGNLDPLLTALLLPGETIAYTPGLLIGHLQFGVPFPTSDFYLDLFAQMGDQVVKTRTDVELADLGGAAFWTPVSAKRISCVTSPAGYSSYGTACPGGANGATLKPLGVNFGSGPPYVAFLSNMPQVGNWAFGVEITSPVHAPPYVIGLDTTAAHIPFGGCQILIGLSPALILFSGQLPHFEETHNIPIPDLATLVGAQVFLQGILLGGNPYLTNGIAVTLGDLIP